MPWYQNIYRTIHITYCEIFQLYLHLQHVINVKSIKTHLPCVKILGHVSIHGLRTFTKKNVLNFALRLLKTRVPSPCCHFYFFAIGVGSHDLYHCCVCDLGEQCHPHLCGLVLLHMKKSLSCSSCSLLSCSKSSCFV